MESESRASATRRPVSRQPIPEDARTAFRGRLFEVVTWQQELFDGSTAIFEKVRRPDTAYVIPVDSSDRLLIAEQQQPNSSTYLGLFGGRIEPGESPEEAARRELLEEGGLAAKDLRLWKAYQFLPKLDWAIYIFVAKGLTVRESTRADPGERIICRRVGLDDFIKLVASDDFGDVEVALAVMRAAADEASLSAMRYLLRN